MKRAPNFFLMLLVFSLALPLTATASKPVKTTLEGCVIKGVFYAVDKQVPTKTGARTMVYRINVQNLDESVPKFNLSPYEGKKISLQGRLHPGDLFEPDPKSLKVLGPCDRDSKKAIAESGE